MPRDAMPAEWQAENEALRRELKTLQSSLREQEQSQEILRRGHEMLQALIAASPLAIITLNPAGNVSMWNPAAEHIFGWKAAEVLGQRLPIVPDGALEEFQKLYEAEMRGLTNRGLELSRRKKDGTPIDIKLWSTALPDPENGIRGVLGIIADVTDQQRAGEALQESEARFRSLVEALRREQEFLRAVLENVADGIVACDSEGILMLFNRATREFHGLPAQPMPAEQWAEHYDLYQADGKTQMRKEEIPLFRAFQGEKVHNAEIVIAPRKGVTRFLLANGQPFYDDQGRKLGAVVAMHDITERKRAEQVRGRLLQQVMSAQEEERRRIARDLHDGIGQSLTSLLIRLRGAEEASTLANARERIRELRPILLSALEEVRSLARGLRPSVLDDLGLAAALENLTTDFRAAHGIKVYLDIQRLDSDRLPAVVETALYRIVQESLTNVARHARAQAVSIMVERDAEHVQAVIEDDGQGFVLLNVPGDDRQFGLSSMRERAALLNGSVTIQSQPGCGTTVEVRIPIPEDNAADAGATGV